jgi:hypothetical protein
MNASSHSGGGGGGGGGSGSGGNIWEHSFLKFLFLRSGHIYQTSG